MKTMLCSILIFTIPFACHATSTPYRHNIAPDVQDIQYDIESTIPLEDLIPPQYSPDDPVRYNIPIYNAATRKFLTYASSRYAYEVYVFLNAIQVSIER